jgi:hypothetical protein
LLSIILEALLSGLLAFTGDDFQVMCLVNILNFKLIQEIIVINTVASRNIYADKHQQVAS